MMNGQKFCLKWDHFRTSVTSVFNNLRQDEELVDITLCCEGQRIKAHRMMLSACSPYFRELLKENPCQHPVFFLKDTSAEDLRAVIEFVYNGEVNVGQAQLASFIKTAEMLQIRGLSGEEEDASSVPVSGGPPLSDRRPAPPPPPELPRSPPAKRRRRSGSPEVAGRPAAVPLSPLPLPRVTQQPQHTPAQPHQSQQSHPSQQQQSQSQSQSQSQQQAEMAAAEQSRLPSQSPADIKVEKVDLTETEDDPSLEAALGRVVSYEGADADLSALAADDSLGEAGPSGGLPADRSMQADRPHRCPICGQAYSRRDTLTHHLHSHRGNTSCGVCGKQFATTSSRNRHMRTNHPEAALPPAVTPAQLLPQPPSLLPTTHDAKTAASMSSASTAWTNLGQLF